MAPLAVVPVGGREGGARGPPSGRPPVSAAATAAAAVAATAQAGARVPRHVVAAAVAAPSEGRARLLVGAVAPPVAERVLAVGAAVGNAVEVAVGVAVLAAVATVAGVAGPGVAGPVAGVVVVVGAAAAAATPLAAQVPAPREVGAGVRMGRGPPVAPPRLLERDVEASGGAHAAGGAARGPCAITVGRPLAGGAPPPQGVPATGRPRVVVAAAPAVGVGGVVGRIPRPAFDGVDRALGGPRLEVPLPMPGPRGPPKALGAPPGALTGAGRGPAVAVPRAEGVKEATAPPVETDGQEGETPLVLVEAVDCGLS